VYAAEGVAVTLQVSVSSGTLSFSWESSSTSCGQSARVSILVDNANVGWIYFAHINNAVTSGPITNGMTLGTVHDWGGCNSGPHVHIGVKNASSYACYTDHSTPTNSAGMTLNQDDAIGKLGGTGATEVQQACATPPSGSSPSLKLSFVRLNHPSGHVEVASYLEDGNYQTLSNYALTGYPAVPQDGNVVPLFKPNGDLSFIRLNHPSGQVECVSYSATSGYATVSQITLTGYPSVPGDGSVIPLYQPDGDLSFIRLNHSSGHVELVGYSKESNFQTMNEYRLASYPAVTPDGSVVPMYWLNGDLVFIRLNHYSGHAELASYSASSGYQNLVNYTLLPYPAVTPDGAVIPMFQPHDGDLTFVRLNHYSGNVEVLTYAVGTGFQLLNDYDLASYPAVPPNTGVLVRYNQ
jgi:hypothetical protein